MVYEFKFPDVGEGIHEGEIVKWLVKEGDFVKEDQALGEIETDKAVVEMPSPKTGTILKLHFKEGQSVKVGEVMVSIGEKGEKISQPSAAPQAMPAAPAVKTAAVSTAAAVSQPAEKQSTQMQSAAQPAVSGQVIATPATRQLARELGVDISIIKGTGAGGRITEDDVKNAGKGVKPSAAAVSSGTALPSAKMPAPALVSYGAEERIKVHGIRKKTAEHMSIARDHIPFAVHMDEIDVSELYKIREREKGPVEKHFGAKLTYLPFVVKAVVAALKKFPYFNSSFDEQANEIVLKKYYNIGIAVDTAEGLMVFPVKDADKKTIVQIAKDIQELADKARNRKIALDELRGGTFTITNIGSLGGTWAVPVINWPEAAILGMLKIADKVVVIDSEMVVKKMLNLVLSFDHRIVDGADAARFMNEIKRHLEDPGIMLTETMI